MLHCGIIGWPVAHSISPEFQNAAFRALGIDAVYERWETTAEELASRVNGLRAPDALGANVTIPHKETVVPLLDSVHDDARILRAVNTIVRRDGELSGYNTDVIGFTRALDTTPGERRTGVAAVIGAGGAARAVVLALARAGASEIAVLNRTPERAIALCDDLAEAAGIPLMPLAMDAATRVLKTAHVVVNATSLGMAHSATAGESPLPAGLFTPDHIVIDVVANPLETPLMKDAAASGATTVGGLSMLVYQGAAAFELWTGRTAPVDIMWNAARAAMTGA